MAAASARQRGELQEELRQLDQALSLGPDNPIALNARGMRALADQQPAAAAQFFARATEAEPREATLWMNLATAGRAQADADAERRALDRALELDRFHFMALLRKAELEERCGRTREAVLGWNAVVQVAASIVDRPPMMDEAIRRGQAYLAAQVVDLAANLDREFGADRAADPDLRRFNACMDHLLGRRAIYRNECQGIQYPFLPADEFFDKRLMPWLADVERHTDAIRDEALALLESPGEALRPYIRMDKGMPENKWTALDQSLDWGACFLWEYGEPNPAVLDRCPATAAALKLAPQNRIPGKAPSAFFSILKPGAHIPPHIGVTNTRAIIHLPLVVPKGCWLRVGGERREWVEGEALAFDDTIEHEAENPTSERRIVLIFDVWNPHLTTAEQDLLIRFYSLQQD
ncbi:aspartyl/asparaginyl beta-hydroxylase domain-containing protein [Sphingomonas sp.]|uniref:aspartyl/asparaginyl beta-hydroxylase domain-containing protein n=1 Tax=Sphingomonas sp. TaxID=28214 RepID=UPI00286A13BD|nr:aspartyl/asparaginyl beta-hydroxylase domain-containing protein [Sphingomonas sp.]